MPYNRTLEEATNLVEEYYDEWSAYLGVGQQWEVFLEYVAPKDLEGTDSIAETSWPTHYRSAKIKFNNRKIRELKSEAELESLVIHELCHLVLADEWDMYNTELGKGRLQELFCSAAEKNVDILTRLLLRGKYGDQRNRHVELDGNTDEESTGMPQTTGGKEGDSRRVLRTWWR